MLSPAATPKTPSVTQMRVAPSPLTRRDYTISSAYRTPSSSQQQQHDLKDYDILNASQIAASYRRGVLPGDALNSHTQSNNRTSNTTPSSSGTGPGAQGQGGIGGGLGLGGGGSYRGYGASSGVTYPPGPGSNGGLKATSSAYDTPYSQERSPKVFKTYNVSPMIDANSPGTGHLKATCCIGMASIIAHEDTHSHMDTHFHILSHTRTYSHTNTHTLNDLWTSYQYSHITHCITVPVYLPSGALGSKGSSGQKGGIGGPKLVSLNALSSLGILTFMLYCTVFSTLLYSTLQLSLLHRTVLYPTIHCLTPLCFALRNTTILSNINVLLWSALSIPYLVY